MRWTSRIAALAAAFALSFAATAQTVPAPPPSAAVPVERRAPVTILVSIDGFRADYLRRGLTPSLSALAASGISAAMRPSFPSITFPNHWTLVTGLRPDRSGIVGNRMLDPRKPGAVFTMATDDPFWWTESEPLWVTAERAGVRTGTMFWPGANVDWNGTRPHDWQQFNGAVNDRQRVDTIIDWLRRPADNRPAFLTLYFDEVDHAGHEFGPDDPHTDAALRSVDAAIGRLRDGLADLGQPANLVVVADHGMAGLGPDRVIPIYPKLPATITTVIADGPYLGVDPVPGKDREVAAALLRPAEHMQCWRKADIPARLAYGKNPRVPAFVCLAEAGWWIQGMPPRPDHPFKLLGGAHGYDNAAPQMLALFVATGPAIRPLGPIATFDNVDVAPLLRDLIGLPAGRDLDGDDTPFRAALVR